MNGSSYWYSIDSTEPWQIRITPYCFLKTDQLMYLVPSKGRLSSANPLALLDSFLIKTAAEANITETNNRKIILLHLPMAQNANRLSLILIREPALLTRMFNTIKGRSYIDPSVSKLVEGEMCMHRGNHFF